MATRFVAICPMFKNIGYCHKLNIFRSTVFQAYDKSDTTESSFINPYLATGKQYPNDEQRKFIDQDRQIMSLGYSNPPGTTGCDVCNCLITRNEYPNSEKKVAADQNKQIVSIDNSNLLGTSECCMGGCAMCNRYC